MLTLIWIKFSVHNLIIFHEVLFSKAQNLEVAAVIKKQNKNKNKFCQSRLSLEHFDQMPKLRSFKNSLKMLAVAKNQKN